MVNRDFKSQMESINALPKPLEGYVTYQKKPSGVYGIWFKNTYEIKGKIRHNSMYIGKLSDLEKGIYYRVGIGYFSFSTEEGFKLVQDESLQPSEPGCVSLLFGDSWVVDEIFKKTGIDTVTENLIPEYRDSLKSLVAFNLIRNQAFPHARGWFDRSYASAIYPNASMDYKRIYEFHEILGQEDFFTKVVSSYSEHVVKNDDNKKFEPILTYEMGPVNNIEFNLTKVNNLARAKTSEIRSIYVIDKHSKIPLYFNSISGDKIDNSALITTVNMFKAYNNKISLNIIDIDNNATKNLEQLIEENIPFIARMARDTNEYKQLMGEYGRNIIDSKNAYTFGERVLFVKKVPITLFNTQLYAYVFVDLEQYVLDIKQAIFKYVDDNEKDVKIDQTIESAGRFIFLSTKDFDIDEVLSHLYSSHKVQHIFDAIQNYVDGDLFTEYSDDAIRGVLLIAFLSKIVNTHLSHGLARFKFSVRSALNKVGNSVVKIYNSKSIVQMFTKEQNSIIESLHLTLPFEEEPPNLNYPNLATLTSGTRKRGRPKGKKNRVKGELPL
ncbi:MAG: hypothetical protein LBD41_00925 [Clostridiales Family XIII bacterium]|jgi:hypothetical protein|nr:hypothetical protein [Clostridiales Family XIII bacterium]